MDHIAFLWPQKHRFPGIDLIRVALLNSSSADIISRGLLDKLWGNIGTDMHSKSGEVILMLTLRAICNSFSSVESVPNFEKAVGIYVNFLNSGVLQTTRNVPVLMAAATLLLKYLLVYVV